MRELFSQQIIQLSNTVNELYEQSKLKMLRFYVCTTDVDPEGAPQVISSDSSPSNFMPEELERAKNDQEKQKNSKKNKTSPSFKQVTLCLSVIQHPLNRRIAILPIKIRKRKRVGHSLSCARDSLSFFFPPQVPSGAL